MKVALIQTKLFWENPQANRLHFQNLIQSISEPVDLIVLPEMFSTGFTMHPKHVAETISGETASWLVAIANSKSAAITGSIVIEENGNFFNRLVFVFPSGEIQTYDKRHLFTLAGEDLEYKAGNQKLIVEYCGFKICPLICYDLRFPVFSRNTEAYDLLLYVANWPAPRVNAWDILLPARAVENQCYVIAVNRIGMDGNNHQYVGHSQVIDYLGNYLLKPIEGEQIQIVSIDKESLLATRKKLAFLNDRDNFVISE
ncbi:amidohydrolase [Flavobacterium sp. CYK-4]|uniref:amidohydrolase n=1 Tax=Flavobacterium lotistagni TaxID=2709660 RepID=UPI00140ABBA7|nr:amidohydrolase [Flavobacterium lotistagni]NHM06002.1 amidohydrolase [Flavobacterium lotistagni]